VSADPRTRDLAALSAHVAQFIRERDWEQFHSPKNLAMSVAIEAAELMEIFQWLDPQQAERVGTDPELRARVEEEAADVFAYLLSLTNRLNIDLGEALLKKMERNAIKYPAEAFRGRSGSREP
jgi:dCTP diphosphatase